jgi:hypothetical protein
MRRALRRPSRALPLLAGLSLVVPTPVPAAEDPGRPGAYCPFPEAGQKPVCFDQVEAEYSDFLTAVDSGQVDDPKVAELEQTLQQDGSTEDRSLALSSLAYGYFMLAQRAAAAEHPDPVLVARLQRWNEILGVVYEDDGAEPEFRNAVREAAVDLHARAPAVATECQPGADGQDCQTTGVLLQTLRQIDDPGGETGVRGALSKLLGRMLEDDEAGSAESPTE